MQLRSALLIAVAVAVLPAEAQQGASADGALTFSAASVRAARLPPDGGGRQGGFAPLNEPGRLRFSVIPLKQLFMIAWNMKDFQIVGPGWLGDERYAIEATMPTDTTEDQKRAMLRNLIADRFKAQIHRETRSLPTYSLAIAKNGLRIPNAPPARAKQVGDSPFATDGFPIPPPELTGVLFFVVNGRARLDARQATMHELADELGKRLGAPVTDETGLTAKFDFILNFSGEGLLGPGGRPFPTPPKDAAGGPEAREPLADIFSALQSEAGLKLEQKKGPVEVIVIDHVEKVPTGN